MANEALEPLREAMDRHAERIKLGPAERSLCRKELRGLEKAIEAGGWRGGGSENIAVIAAAALGRTDLLAAMARFEETAGLGGSEHGSPASFYHGAVATAFMVGLRDAREAGDTDYARVIERRLAALWLWDALVSIQVNGVLVTAIAGNRAKHHSELSGHRAEILAHALDLPRPNKGVRMSPAQAALLGTKRYSDPTAAEHWGLTEGIRCLLVAVVKGDVIAARQSMPLMMGTQPGDGWELVRRRLGVEKVFYGTPNGNGMAVAYGQAYFDGRFIAAIPDDQVNKSNSGWQVERRDGKLRARCRDYPWIEHPEMGGDLLWKVSIIGSDKPRFEPEAA